MPAKNIIIKDQETDSTIPQNKIRHMRHPIIATSFNFIHLSSSTCLTALFPDSHNSYNGSTSALGESIDGTGHVGATGHDRWIEAMHQQCS
ncbi:uncharacterized protein AtWU_00407 [Aspergillus tubingensis]|uniref:uncharacterized protein n=1 Tax=Aspergillus tubingensis TaxID=5068 RepID=UPI00157A163D|nr:uncharacterized protein AtWU_00407 [Aspergillus tubingensis]GFN10612.1 hypothetical protein AtWU_00407 [Aspergillus tubingensis]